MWLSVFMLAFLAATTYFLAIQGLTSALIMAVCTVLSMAVAFGASDYVAQTFLLDLVPNYAYLIAFIGLFVVPLIITRVVLDALVSRCNLLPQLLDKAGAAAVGLFTAVLITGTLAIGLQMVPWPSIVGFNRLAAGAPLDDQTELWFQPDRVAASFGAALSGGVFSGPTPYAARHPDLVTELGWIQAAGVGVRREVPADALEFVGASEVAEIYDLTTTRGGSGNDVSSTYEPVETGADKLLRVAIKLIGDAAKLNDADDDQRFVPASVRLIGKLHGVPQVYGGIAIPDDDSPNKFVRSWKQGTGGDAKKYVASSTFRVPETKVIEVVFRVPKSGFEPEWVAYKLGGLVSYSKRGLAAPPETATADASATDAADTGGDAPPSGGAGGGRVSGVRFRSSHFGDDMPLTLTAYSGAEVEKQGDVLEQGRLEGRLADQGEKQDDPPLARFKVPDGKRLLQLNVENLRAGSVLGKALNWSVQTVENYILEDDSGTQMTPVGKYAVAKVGNDVYFELQYFPEYAAGGGRSIRPFNRIKSAHLKGDYQLVYLYLVDQGRQAIKFSPGGNKRSMDLRDQNLVAN